MSELAKKTCDICNAKLGFFNKFKLTSGDIICPACVQETALGNVWTKDNVKTSSIEDIKTRQIKVKEIIEENTERVNEFKATIYVGNLIWFDDTHKYFALPYKNAGINMSYIFEYKDLLAFEVLEDGSTITKGGLGKALVGGFFFGLAGALAGGTSKTSKPMCDKLDIKITTRVSDYPVVYINVIKTQIKKSNFLYKALFQKVQEALSKFQIIIDELEQEKEQQREEKEEKRYQNTEASKNILSVADEIKKLKELLDVEAITQEEYNTQKNKLLNN